MLWFLLNKSTLYHPLDEAPQDVDQPVHGNHGDGDGWIEHKICGVFIFGIFLIGPFIKKLIIYSTTHLMSPPRMLINLSMAIMVMEMVELGIKFVLFSFLEFF